MTTHSTTLTGRTLLVIDRQTGETERIDGRDGNALASIAHAAESCGLSTEEAIDRLLAGETLTTCAFLLCSGLIIITNTIAPKGTSLMFGLNLLRNAIARLAGSVNSLADTADEIRVSVRQQLALDRPPVEIAALPDATSAGMPIPASTRPAGASESADGQAAVETPVHASRNGRRKAAATSG